MTGPTFGKSAYLPIPNDKHRPGSHWNCHQQAIGQSIAFSPNPDDGPRNTEDFRALLPFFEHLSVVPSRRCAFREAGTGWRGVSVQNRVSKMAFSYDFDHKFVTRPFSFFLMVVRQQWTPSRYFWLPPIRLQGCTKCATAGGCCLACEH
jgi:hypothetical protein